MLAGFAWLRVAGCSRFGWVVWGGLRTYTALATAALASAATRPHPSSQRRQGWPIGRKEKGQSRVWPLNGVERGDYRYVKNPHSLSAMGVKSTQAACRASSASTFALPASSLSRSSCLSNSRCRTSRLVSRPSCSNERANSSRRSSSRLRRVSN